MDIYIAVESINITCMIFRGTHIFVTIRGAAADETTIEVEWKFNQIRWIVFG